MPHERKGQGIMRPLGPSKMPDLPKQPRKKSDGRERMIVIHWHYPRKQRRTVLGAYNVEDAMERLHDLKGDGIAIDDAYPLEEEGREAG